MIKTFTSFSCAFILFSGTFAFSSPGKFPVLREMESDSILTKEVPKKKRVFIIPDEKRYSDLIQLQIFYAGQIRKEHVPEKYKAKYRDALAQTEAEINEMKLAKNPNLSEEEKIELLKPADEVEISSWVPPVILAHELGSTVFGLGVSYLGDKYSFPIIFSADKVLDEQYSLGGYVGYFEEHIRSSKPPLNVDFYEYNQKNYSYSYISIGGRAMYHLLNPHSPVKIEKLSSVYWDLYSVASLGYSIASSPISFIKNNQYNESPSKKGINFGLGLGLRYMLDDNLGVYAEVGYSRIGYATVGFSYSFRKGPKKVVPTASVDEKSKPGAKTGKGTSQSKKKK